MPLIIFLPTFLLNYIFYTYFIAFHHMKVLKDKFVFNLEPQQDGFKITENRKQISCKYRLLKSLLVICYEFEVCFARGSYVKK